MSRLQRRKPSGSVRGPAMPLLHFVTMFQFARETVRRSTNDSYNVAADLQRYGCRWRCHQEDAPVWSSLTPDYALQKLYSSCKCHEYDRWERFHLCKQPVATSLKQYKNVNEVWIKLLKSWSLYHTIIPRPFHSLGSLCFVSLHLEAFPSLQGTHKERKRWQNKK